MDRKQINKIIADTKKRSMIISIFVSLIMAFALLGAGIIIASLNNEKNYYIHYDEKSDLDYKVYLKENDYFGEYLGKDNQYIASLIDYIEADFKYNMTINEDIKYSYYYMINAEVEVLDNSGKPLYKKTDNLVKKQLFDDLNDNSFDINKKVNLDYNYYNDIVSTFIKRYNLNGVTSRVVLKMYVGIEGDCEEFESSLTDSAVISMTVPLTTQTVNIDMNYVLNNGTDKLLKCREKNILTPGVIIGSILEIIAIVLIFVSIRYTNRTRSALTIYNKRLKSIFSNYGQYISKIKTEIEYKKFQIVLVEEFEDLFEVRNSSASPILFCQDSTKTKSAFVVPTNSGLVYIYYYSLKDVILEND